MYALVLWQRGGRTRQVPDETGAPQNGGITNLFNEQNRFTPALQPSQRFGTFHRDARASALWGGGEEREFRTSFSSPLRILSPLPSTFNINRTGISVPTTPRI